MPKNLAAFFCPKSIAVIGASRHPQKVGSVILKNILSSKFLGQIYPVNPQVEVMEGLKCYPDISNLPEVPDLAIIALPVALSLKTLTQLGEQGVKNIVVIASGFKESGENGERLEKELAGIAQKYQLNLLGPNCLGFLNNTCSLNATFAGEVKNQGNLRFITQSGAIAASLFDWCNFTGLGINTFITLGNKTVLNENDILEYLESLSEKGPIGLYLESISDGPKFLQLVSKLSKKDPIFILKPGKTQAGVSAMKSHTGSIAGEDQILEAVMGQAGVVRCQSLEEFFDMAQIFAWGRLPKGPRVAVVSNAGGPAVMAADALAGSGLKLVEFDQGLKQDLIAVLPPSSAISNPVDILGDADAERFRLAAEIILRSEQIDILLVILTPQMMTEVEATAQAIGKLSQKYQKPIICAFMGGNLVESGEKILREYKVPIFRFPERAILAISALFKFKKWQEEEVMGEVHGVVDNVIFQGKAQEIINQALNNDQPALNNFQANELISVAGILTPPTIRAENFDQVKEFAQNYSYPVVLKLSSPDLLHKKDKGGVIVGIKDNLKLENAWEKMIKLAGEMGNGVQIQVQKEIEGGVEVIIGVKNDPTFGKVLLFGAGGSLAEIISDRNLHLLPLDLPQARELVEQSKVFKLLPKPHDKLYQILLQFSKLAEILPDIEIEINPAIITADNIWAVDCKAVLSKSSKRLENIVQSTKSSAYV